MPGEGVRVVREAGRLTVEMRGQLNLVGAVVIALWLCAWALGEAMVVRRLFFSEEVESGSWFLAAWLALWTLGGALALRALVGNLGRGEILTIQGSEVALRRVPLGRRRTFAVPEVRNLRLDAADRRRLAFEAAGRTVRFGRGLTDADAQAALAALATWLPAGAPRPP